MIIAMITHMSGGRYDDRPWAPPGVPFEVPDEEGEGLIRWHHAVWIADSAAPVIAPAVPVPVSLPAETAAGPVPAEAAGVPGDGSSLFEQMGGTITGPEPPKPADSKAAWIAYAVSQGAQEDDAAAMTKIDLMSRYGGRL